MLRGPTAARWGQARKFCKSQNMVLPYPSTMSDNKMYAAAGTTWLDVNVNHILNNHNKHFHYWMRRQRGWMNRNGNWSARQATFNAEYYCVKQGIVTVSLNDN